MTDFRALCAELVDELEDWIAYGDEADCADAHAVVDRARAALAQPEPQGPTDEELLDLGSDVMGDCLPCDHDLLIAFARSVLARWGRTAIEPVPVTERLPEPEDCDETGLTCNGGGWCWWFEQSSQMWVADFYSSHYTHWLPHHALPVPQQEVDCG